VALLDRIVMMQIYLNNPSVWNSHIETRHDREAKAQKTAGSGTIRGDC